MKKTKILKPSRSHFHTIIHCHQHTQLKHIALNVANTFPQLVFNILPADHSKRLVTGEIGGPRKHRDGLLPFGGDTVV